ncbi:MAG: hypothetical protein KGD58_01470 [Candidatus Lokiarchaeota archaeon]|nr:hypothetical protein [Candidatus Lokiarchaeota archaeon]
MPSIFSWIKKEFSYIKKSFMDIIRGLILFILASSGLSIAILLRYFDYNGTVITFFGLIVEFIALLLCYLLLRGYLKSKEEQDTSKPKEKK